MTHSKKQIFSVVFLLLIILALPVALFLMQNRQNLRSKALQGKGNFLLSADSLTSTVGKDINVLVSLQLTDSALKVSGVDFLLLYDKNLLDVGNVVPQITSVDAAAAFTDAPIVTSGGKFDDQFNFVRVAEVARKPDDQLAGGTTATIKLANITFRGRGNGGQATIKFPDDDKYVEISGTGTYIGPTVTPTPNGPTITPGGPTFTPTPTGPTATPTPSTLTNGLIGFWKMDETSGSTAADSSGGGNSGSTVGTSIVDGKIGKTRQFNGLTDYISVANPANFNFNYNSPFSVTAWIYPTRGHGDYQTIVSKAKVGGPDYPGYVFRLNPQSQLEFVLINTNVSPYAFAWIQVTGTDFAVNTWYHVVATYDGSGSANGMQLYIDGNLAAKTSPWNNLGSGPITNSEPLLIGRQNPPTIGYTPIDNNQYGNFAGNIDEVRIYNRALSASEVSGIYSAN